MKRIQLIRNVAQLLFLVLLIIGVYMDLKMVLMVLLPASILLGNFFCGWVCPFGTAQELFGMIGSLFVKKKLKMPKVMQKYLQYVRYIIFAVSLIGVGSIIFENINAYATFMSVVDITNIALSASVIIMGSLLIISLFFERPFCNYLCTEGVKYGAVSLARIFSIKRNEGTCVDCKKCEQACPMNIAVSEKSAC